MIRRMIAVALLLAPQPALAQPRERTAAQAMFDQAREAMAKSDYAAACPKFAESQRLDPDVATLANLAACEEKLGTVASAWTHARAAIHQLPAGDPLGPPLREIVARVERRLPQIVIRLASGAPKGTRVRRDDVDLDDASLGTAIPVDPGDHTITVVAPGRKDVTRRVTVVEAKTEEVAVAPGAKVAAIPAIKSQGGPPAKTDESPPNGGSGQTVGYVLGAIGIVGLGVAAFEFASITTNRSKMDCQQSDHTCASTAGATAANDARAARTPFYVGLAVGAVGVGTGAYFLLSGSGTADVGVQVGPRGAAVVGRF